MLILQLYLLKCIKNQYIIKKMLEVPNQHEELSDCYSDSRGGEVKQFKLPKIERLPSRGVQKEIRSSTKLPTLRSQTQGEGSDAGSERRDVEEEDFVGHVQRRLRLIMGEHNIIQIQESEQSDGQGFEKKICENKEIIKQTKRRNQRIKKQNEQHNYFNKLNQSKKLSQKNKLDANDRRPKQFKDVSLENKCINRKKDILCSLNKNALAIREFRDSQRDVPKSSIVLKESNNQAKEIKSKEQLMSIHKVFPTPLSNKNSQLSAEPKKMRKQYSQKNITPIQKNEQLFDAIHNFLQNPKRIETEVNSQKIVKERMELQEKLREYEQKLNGHQLDNQAKQISQSEREQNVQMVTSTQWRKVGVLGDHPLVSQGSSFEQEIDRIGQFQQRNDKSLQKYVQNQKLLLQVQLAHRRNSRERHLVSNRQKSN